MASIFGHALVGITLGNGMLPKETTRLMFLGVIFTIIPDADVLGFLNGVPYDSPWGHRGFTHSFCFALFSSIIGACFFKSSTWKAFIFLFLCMASHSILDGMTSGGMGVAYFWPFENNRYFLPWRPIKVSPIGASRFFSERGFQVLKSEALVIGIPCVLALGIITGIKRSKHGDKRSSNSSR